MGPITLFDKSFLQSLTVDESVWFDHYFTPNICPVFFVETLADLAKSKLREGRTPEHEVAIIAEKTPEVSSYPCAYHGQICITDLMGYHVPMNGQIPMPGAKSVRADGLTGLVFPRSLEAEAMARWQAGEFEEVERISAHRWRAELSALDLKKTAKTMHAIGIDGKSCRSLEQAANISRAIAQSRNKPFEQMNLLFHFVQIGPEYMRPVLERWQIEGYRPLSEFAPYAAHVFTVELFFQIALAANLISSDRPSNRADIAYLFYLPFCEVFTSTDRLHEKCAPLFLRDDQDFVWGEDLKAELRHTNAHYASTLSQQQHEAGLNTIPHIPVEHDGSVIVRLWNRHSPGWRSRVNRPEPTMTPEMERMVVERSKAFQNAPAVELTPEERRRTEFEHTTVERSIHRRKGRWWQVPKDLPNPDE